MKYHTITAFAVVSAACSSVAMAGLSVSAIGKTYTRNASITPANLYFAASDTGGSTSVRNSDEATLEWKTDGYYQRNRDLGQVFNLAPGQNLTLDSIVLRTGNSSTAVLPGTPGAGVFLQIFELSGTPTINQNGTVYPAQSAHGFTTHASSDDYVTGITYTSLRTVTGGAFPNLPPTTVNGGETSHLHYMRWDLTGTDEITLVGGKRYAFMVGFTDPAPNQGFTLANQNRVGQSSLNTANPTLFKDSNATDWWSVRREGDGTLPPTMIPGATPPANPALNQQLKNESLFGAGNAHYALSPTTDGYPDVDTYRTFTFYIESKAPAPTLAVSRSVLPPSFYLAASSVPDQAGTTGTTIRYFPTGTSNIDRGQTFTAMSTFALDKITVKVASLLSGAASAPVAVEFWQNNSGTWSLMSILDGGTLPASLAAGDFLTLDIADQSLTAGKQYGFVLRFDEAAANREINLARLGDVYTDGSVFQRTGMGYPASRGGTPTLNTANDLVFYLTPVPEPAMLSLVLASGTLLLRRRSR